MRPLGSGTCKVLQGSKRDPLFIRRTGNDVDQIDIVAHLRIGAPDMTVFSTPRCLRAQAQQACLVLIDTNRAPCAPAPSNRN